MKHFVQIFFLSPIVILFSLFLAAPALAFPPFPSSFYGTVKVNDANVPDGTVIQALIGGQVYAEEYTQTHQGNSFFALDVAGDDTGTAALDGGRDGDAVQFKIGGLLADQTAVWHGGTNVVLNLTVTSSKPISKPPVIPTSVPTQTEIVILIRASLIPSTSTQSAPSPTLTPASPIATKSSRSLPVATIGVQASSVNALPQNDKENRSNSSSLTVVVVIALPIMTAIGYAFWTLRKKKIQGKLKQNGFDHIELRGDIK